MKNPGSQKVWTRGTAPFLPLSFGLVSASISSLSAYLSVYLFVWLFISNP